MARKKSRKAKQNRNASISLAPAPKGWKGADFGKSESTGEVLQPYVPKKADAFHRLCACGSIEPLQAEAGARFRAVATAASSAHSAGSAQVVERVQGGIGGGGARCNGAVLLFGDLRRSVLGSCGDGAAARCEGQARWDALVGVLLENKTIRELGGRKRVREEKISKNLKAGLDHIQSAVLQGGEWQRLLSASIPSQIDEMRLSRKI